jgi:hypothetical protein
LKRYRWEWVFAIITLVGLLILWVKLESGIEREMNEFLVSNSAALDSPNESQLRQVLIDEIHRRASYFQYSDKKDELEGFLKSRYFPDELSVQWGKTGIAEELSWSEKDSQWYLQGILRGQGYQIRISLPISHRWLIDAMSSELSRISEKSERGWSFLLEEGDERIPERHMIHLRDHARLESQFQIMDLDFFAYAYSRIEIPLEPVHVVVVLDKEHYHSKLWSQFFYYGGLLCALLLLVYFFPSLRGSRFTILHRVLVFQLICFLFMGWFLWEESTESEQRSRQRRRYDRERNVVSGGFRELVIPPYRVLRHQLPFQEEVLYTLKQERAILLFQAREGRLEGATYLDLGSEEQSSMFLFFSAMGLCIFASLWSFQRNDEFFKAMAARLKEMTGSNDGDSKALLPLFSYRELFQSFEGMVKAVQSYDLHQKSVSRWIGLRLEEDAAIEVLDENTTHECVLLFIAPISTFPSESSGSELFFEIYTKTVETIRKTASRYGGVVILDRNWEQGILFCLPQYHLSRQRAVVCGMEILRSLERLNPQDAFIGMIDEGSIQVRKVEAEKREEILARGELLRRVRERWEEGNRSSVVLKGFELYISELTLSPLKSMFEFSEGNLEGFARVLGVLDIEQHLPLLVCDSEDLQRTALELSSLHPKSTVLEAILDALPNFSLTVLQSCREILTDALNVEEKRVRIFEKLTSWSTDPPDCIGIILDALMEEGRDLSTAEQKVLLEIQNPRLRERVLKLILKGSPADLGEELNRELEASSIHLKPLYYFYQVMSHKNESSLQKLWELCLDKTLELRSLAFIRISRIFEKVSVDISMNDLVRNWYERGEQIKTSQVRGILREENAAFTIGILPMLAHLQMTELIPELVDLHQKTSDNRLKSELARFLKKLGADNFLIENLV